MCFRYLFIVIVLFISKSYGLLDPFSLTAGVVAGAGALGYNFQFFKENSYCKFKECCIDTYIPVNIQALNADFEQNLFGQHIAKHIIIAALSAHYKHLKDSKKPLVMVLNGSPGTGKNFVADRIAKHLYKNGEKSQYVHKFYGRTTFPLQSDVPKYRTMLKEHLEKAVKDCERSLFIFDEVEKMPPGIFDDISTYLDHHDNVNRQNYRHSVFLFLTNAAGIEVASALSALVENGKLREDTKLVDFEKIAEFGAYNVEGGLQKSALIESSLIDHFIPFLPLEKRHVLQCITNSFQNKCRRYPTADEMEYVEKSSTTYFKNIYSTTGCKRIEGKVSVACYS